jgi:hypothetical protein
MITEHIELPPPAHRGDGVTRYFDGHKFRVVSYQYNDEHGNFPLLLAHVESADEADRIAAEMRIRMKVAATLLGLKP